jgi:hypothetical protein
MLDYTEKELVDYDTYLKTVKKRIQKLNTLTDTYVLISQIDIENVKQSKDDKGKWEFLYKIETGTKFVDYQQSMGLIKYTDFHTWKKEKTQKIRDQKLKLLGI